MEELNRTPDTLNPRFMIFRIGGDQYGAEVSQVGPEKGVLYLTRHSHSDVRVKKNRIGSGYGEQVMTENGSWKYKDISKYRHFSTWYPADSKVDTYFNPEY